MSGENVIFSRVADFLFFKMLRWEWDVFMSVQVAVIMGSKSDWETMKHACEVLDELEIGYEKGRLRTSYTGFDV